MKKTYNELYNSLNSEQKSAVDAIYGAIMVLAGPGTGKTHLLITRVLHILKYTDCKPDNILMLTFTNNAAAEMTERLLHTELSYDALKIHISTFHSFCSTIKRDYSSYFIDTHTDMLSPLEHNELVYKQLEMHSYPHLISNRDALERYIKDIKDKMSTLKKEGYTYNDAHKILQLLEDEYENDAKSYYKTSRGIYKKGDRHPDNYNTYVHRRACLEEFFIFWKRYDDTLKQLKKSTLDDLIPDTIHTIKTHKALQYDLQERYQWVMVDEYQDTNTSQNELLWLLTEDVERPNIMVVGDDDQSIFRFQGASIENLWAFKERFKDCIMIELQRNYRSSKAILKASYDMVEHNTKRINSDKTVYADGNNKHYDDVIKHYEHSTKEDEYAYLLHMIRDKQRDNNDIGVLVRERKEGYEIASRLSQIGITAHIDEHYDILEKDVIKDLLLYLEYINNPTEHNFKKVITTKTASLPIDIVHKWLLERG